MAPAARITVWSDYVCPFCYLEEPMLDRLRREFGDRVEIDWRAFELRPEPAPALAPDAPYLHRVWDQAVYPMARERGMTLRLPPVQPRSRKALEAAELARAAGRFDAMHHALFRAFFENGRDLGGVEVLLAIGESAGLDREALRAALDEGRFTAKVVEDETLARRFGITGVPTMLVGPPGAPLEEAEPLVGAVPYAQLRDAVAWYAG